MWKVKCQADLVCKAAHTIYGSSGERAPPPALIESLATPSPTPPQTFLVVTK